MEFRMPNIVIEDGTLKVNVKRGGFTFDGSNLVVELEPINSEVSATAETPRRGRPPKNEPQEGA